MFQWYVYTIDIIYFVYGCLIKWDFSYWPSLNRLIFESRHSNYNSHNQENNVIWYETYIFITTVHHSEISPPCYNILFLLSPHHHSRLRSSICFQYQLSPWIFINIMRTVQKTLQNISPRQDCQTNSMTEHDVQEHF